MFRSNNRNELQQTERHNVQLYASAELTAAMELDHRFDRADL